MAKMLAASHKRPSCCRWDDDFYRPGRIKRLRKHIQRRREQRQWKREARNEGQG